MSNQEGASGTAATPRSGPIRPFGLSREHLNRVELTFILRGGAQLAVSEQLLDEVTPESLDRYAAQLSEQVTSGQSRAFSDQQSTPGVRAWINLGEVVAFSVRQAKG
ncbi:MAG: hypothetical protein IT307_08280 [Chloroflexi bacterium]|nr:hypothetical protein [Chloroflexota bacterium]